MTVWTACCTTKRVPSVWSWHPVITPCRSGDRCCATVSLCSRSTLRPVSCYVCRADYTHKTDIKIVNTLAAEQNQPKPCMVLNGIDEKRTCCQANHIALYDVIDSCEIVGSSDASIKNVVPTDLSLIMKSANIRQIYANGKTAAALYNKYQFDKTGVGISILPSTSPANAVWTFERLCEAWKIIRE